MMYTHIVQLMTHTANVHIAAAYLATILLSLFGILQRLIKSQKVCISFGHSKSRYLFSQNRL